MVVVDPRGAVSAAVIIRAAIAMEVSVSPYMVVVRLPQHVIFGATPFAVADAEKPTLANGPALLPTVLNRAAVRHSLAVRLRPVHSVDLDRA